MTDQILKKLEEHDEQFAKIGERLDDHDKKFDRVIKAVVDNKESLETIEENMATKDDTNKIMSTLDELVGLHKKTEQEQVMMGKQVKHNTAEIEKIKPLVGLESS